MKRYKRTRVQGDLFRSTLKAFPYFGSEVRSARVVDSRFTDVGASARESSPAYPDQSCHRSPKNAPPPRTSSPISVSSTSSVLPSHRRSSPDHQAGRGGLFERCILVYEGDGEKGVDEG